MPGYKDTDYLAVSSRVRYLETRLLGRDAFDKMIGAGTLSEAFAVATAAYGFAADDAETLAETERENVYAFIASNVHDFVLTDVVRLPFDYANIKAALKARRMGIKPDRMMRRGGTVDPVLLCAAVAEGSGEPLTDKMKKAVAEVSERLSETNDPAQIDLVCDRVLYEDIFERVKASGMDFLASYYTAKADLCNIASFLRVRCMGFDAKAFDEAFLPSENGLKKSFFDAFSTRPLTEFAEELARTRYGTAATCVRGDGSVDMGALRRATEKELHEEALSLLHVSFGPQVPFAYLLLKTEEIGRVRTVLACREAGLSREAVSERLGQYE